jgi:2-dehydro-3-deoxygluconokinase
MGPEYVIVRLGAEGALAVGPSGDPARAPAISVEVVEPVGAGDAFNAGFLSGQLRGWTIMESLQLGNILGGLATTASGDVEALPTWDEVRAYLDGASITLR